MKYALSQQLVMLAELPVKPNKRAEFLDYALANLEISRAAAGNIAFDILIDEARPDHILFHEVWESAQAQQVYMAWRIERGDLTTLLSYLNGEPKFTALRTIVA